ncbi:MAG: SHOCT domain-containing protein [Gemmatimonadota bacterium]
MENAVELPAQMQQMQMMGPSWHRGGLFMGMHWAWWLFWLVTLVVLVWAFWRLFADQANQRRAARELEQAEQELRTRFARGEIDEEEFRKRLTVLRSTTTGR